MQGPHPMKGFDKKYEQKVANEVQEKYKVDHNKRGFIVETTTDSRMRMGTLLLACKMMCKCRASVVPAYVIQVAGRCEKGVCYNWLQYLCEEFLYNVREA